MQGRQERHVHLFVHSWVHQTITLRPTLTQPAIPLRSIAHVTVRYALDNRVAVMEGLGL
jgi:hypothetical protein